MKRTLKNLAKFILYHTGAFDAVRVFQRNRVIILMYHRFSDKPEPFKIPKDVFEKQIRFLHKRYNFISLQHYAEVLEGAKEHLPPNSIILTIDDGYRDNYSYGYPILKKYAIPATIFLTTDFISCRQWLWANKLEFILKNTEYKRFSFPLNGSSTSFDVSNFSNWHETQLTIFNYCTLIPDKEKNNLLDSLAKDLKVEVPPTAVGDFLPLSWEQIREMQKNGITFGSHTCSHPILSRLPEPEIEREVRLSKAVMEQELDTDIDLFCYPNGKSEDFSENVVSVLRNNGFRAAVTTICGHNLKGAEDPYRLKRVSISSENKAELLRRLINP